MPPKKDGKDKKKDDAGGDSKVKEEIAQLERTNNDMMVEQTFVTDKFRQMRMENDRLKEELNAFKSRLGSATEDYADILEHRQEQIKAEEVKLRSIMMNVERLEGEIQRQTDEIRSLKEVNGQQASKLNDAAAVIKDKEKLEDAVRKQHDLIEKQSEELKNLKNQIEEKDNVLDQAKNQIEELTLKSCATTELKILFDEPWLVQISHARLKGDVPMDREWNSLSTLGSGKLLMLYGGLSRSNLPTHEVTGREVAILNLDTMLWERPSSARTLLPSHGHTATSVSRTKAVIFGGVHSDIPSAEVSIFNTDTMKWMQPQIKGVDRPIARAGHACTNIREKLFIFGGISADDTLLNDIWILDQDSMSWSHVICYGTKPSPRRGATINATEDGRRLYVFGGNDGTKAQNDIHYLDLEKLTWSPMPVHIGVQPEPREDHVSNITSKYLIISGGCTTGGVKRLGDVQVFDLYSPRWECLDEGVYISSMVWLKQRATYTCFYGNKLFTLKPSSGEKLYELATMEFALPEDIERMRRSKKRDLGLSERLELLDDAVCGTNSIELSWRPPTKNADRIERYKLMIATLTGVVKDVYQGKDQRYKVTGLKPNTEYILCVKAIYNDGSFLWSESKGYMTKL